MAARLAGRLPAAVTVLTVGRLVTPIGTAVLPTVEKSAFEPINAEGAEIVRALGVEPSTRVEFGDPARAIVELAARERYDAVVVGHHGRGCIGEGLLGSVAKAVTGAAPCPVVVVRAAVPERIEKILVAVGGPTHARRATEAAACVAQAFGATVTLV